MKKLNLMQKARYCGYILLVAGLLSCSTTKEPELKGWYLKCCYDNGWSWTVVKCDSLQMISKSEAIVYVNGKSTKIVGDELRPLHY